MADQVLDASAILAFLFDEPGGERVAEALGTAVVSSVNLSEVVAKLIDRGRSEKDAATIVVGMPCAVASFDLGLGLRAGALWANPRRLGLSLGDRACLALAERERLPVLTADRAWIGLDIGVDIRLIR
jgi:PIN domain nuclease of toxin-antitoxin system